MIWPTTEIGKVGQIFDGPHATPKTIDKGPIFLGISALNQGRIELSQTRHVSNEDFIKWTRRVTPKPDDIVFSYETRIGEVAIIPEGLECCLGRRMGLVRLDISKILPRFFLYNYLSPSYQKFLVSRTIPGSTVDRLSIKEFPSFPIPLPPMDEQKRIVKVLEGIDDKIELNRQMNETLEEMARSTFKSWFVDFDPVIAKAAGQAPAHMSADTAELFPDTFDANGLPKGWSIGVVGDLASHCKGTVKPQENHLVSYEHYSLPAFDKTGMPIVEFGSEIKSNKTPIVERSILLSKLNPDIERVWVPLAKSSRPQICSTEFLVMLPTKRASLVYLNSLFRSYEFRKMYQGLVTGTSKSHQRVGPQSLLGMRALIPPKECVLAFTEFAGPLLYKALKNREQNQTLADLRDTLLPKLMSGEIRLRDVEKTVEDQL